eukprot:evm.model.scf_3311.1 EVM.evm.TU.scf_3311.1   scf_3311:2767-3567(-)
MSEHDKCWAVELLLGWVEASDRPHLAYCGVVAASRLVVFKVTTCDSLDCVETLTEAVAKAHLGLSAGLMPPEPHLPDVIAADRLPSKMDAARA